MLPYPNPAKLQETYMIFCAAQTIVLLATLKLTVFTKENLGRRGLMIQCARLGLIGSRSIVEANQVPIVSAMFINLV